MIYTAEITVYDPDENEMRKEKLFISGDNYSDITNKLINYYGENELEDMFISLFGPDDFIAFDEEDKHLFEIVKDKLEKKVVW